MKPIIAVPAIVLLLARAYVRKSLTVPALVTAGATAALHACYPSSLPFTLLALFYYLGSTATKVKHDVKATLTLSSTGSSGGEGARTSNQVLANSGVASALILLHLWRYGFGDDFGGTGCFGGLGPDKVRSLILLGIIANYAAVMADTLSSELGILSRSKPRLITAPWKVVPPGTNGGVTVTGFTCGAAGALVVGAASVFMLDFCPWQPQAHIAMVGHRPELQIDWTMRQRVLFVAGIAVWGALGSVFDSILGALLQASVVDKRSGKVVEGAGGLKVLVQSTRNRSDDKVEGSRRVHSGHDVLDNNQVNLAMATTMGLGAIVLGSLFLEVPLSTFIKYQK